LNKAAVFIAALFFYIMNSRTINPDVFVDLVKENLSFSERLDPETFLLEHFIKTSSGRLFRIKMTLEQKEAWLCSILGCSTYKLTAIRNLLRDDEDLIREEKAIRKIKGEYNIGGR
jgi:hypothetical protein